MFDKRLLAMVPGAAKYILANVLFQWIALVCNIALFIVIGVFLQATFEGAADAAMAIGVMASSVAAIAVRMVRRAIFCTAMIDAGMNGTHTSSVTAAGSDSGASATNSVMGAIRA